MSTPLTVDTGPGRTEARIPAGKVAGLVIVAFLPAVFWTAILAALASAIGFALSTTAILVTASAMALFLTAIYAALAASSEQS